MKIAIVEDNIRLLENLALLLDNEEGITVTGTYSLGREALEALQRDKADVVLVDLGLPDMDGTELIGRLKAAMPETEILVNTVFDNRRRIHAALEAGASGYVLKGATAKELIAAVHNSAGEQKSERQALRGHGSGGVCEH